MNINPNRFKYYNHLGFNNPYYTITNSEMKLYERFDSALIENRQYREIDITSIIELLSRGYFFNDQTIVKGLFKTPWMAKPNIGNCAHLFLPKYEESPDYSNIEHAELF